jgi:hypothetical protein
MDQPTELEMRRWLQQWRSASLALARVRHEELRDVDLEREALALEPLALSARRTRSDVTTSGLIEQQKLFHRTSRGA